MLEGLASALLAKILGDYIEAIDTKNLRFTLSGELELTNLQLKKSALNSLNLPVVVEEGFVSKLFLSVPWRSLGSQPAIIKIEKIFLLAEAASNREVRICCPSHIVNSGAPGISVVALKKACLFLLGLLLVCTSFSEIMSIPRANAIVPIPFLFMNSLFTRTATVQAVLIPSALVVTTPMSCMQYDEAEEKKRAQADKIRRLELAELVKSSRIQAANSKKGACGFQELF
jgi:hypothetical protein